MASRVFSWLGQLPGAAGIAPFYHICRGKLRQGETVRQSCDAPAAPVSSGPSTPRSQQLVTWQQGTEGVRASCHLALAAAEVELWFRDVASSSRVSW
jgi:hypothetical protein